MELLIGLAVALGVLLLLFFAGWSVIFGMVIIGENEVGVGTKRFDVTGKKLPPGKQIALDNEPGFQADTLAPGLYF
ncbi:MAG: hypothetical protein HXY40_02885 [Chloroflexi bacterium]|nr:hypothetical protein [Chloroflexota bacterium]